MRLIDADKVKAESREHCKTCIINGTKHCKTCVVNLICDRLDLQPTVEPQRPQEPKLGHWIERIERDEYNDYEEEWFECDQCHIDSERPYNFCPNCGADMKGGAE